jgi:hypothetical protein
MDDRTPRATGRAPVAVKRVGVVPGLLHLAMTPSGMLVSMRRRRARLVLPPRSPFAGFRFPPEMIVLAIRWYLRFGLSYRDVEELLAERGVQVDHVRVFQWVRRFTPPLPRRARTPATAGVAPDRAVRQQPGSKPITAS